jgi:hypothetical protein
MQLTTHSSYWCCSSDADSSHLQPKDKGDENNRAKFYVEMKRWVSIAEIHYINMAKMAKYHYGKNGIILIWQRGKYIIMANNTLYPHGKNGKISVWQEWHYIDMAKRAVYYYGK